MRDGDRSLLGAYRETRWTVSSPDGPTEIAVGERVDLDLIPVPAAVVTAYNPRSVPCTPALNEAAQSRLQREIAAAGFRYLPALARGVGQEPSDWNEPGFLVFDIDQATAVGLGLRYDQNAILWISGDGTPSIVSARAGFADAAPGTPL